MLVTTAVGTSASAAAETTTAADVAPGATVEHDALGFDPDDMTGEEVITEGLEQDGLEVDAVEVDLDQILIGAEAESPQDQFAFVLQLDNDTATGTYTVTDEIQGETVTTAYDLAVQTSTPERAVFTLTNPVTDETYHDDSTTANESVAFVIPVAFAAISLSTALYYLAIGAAIVIGGVLAVEAAKSISKIIAENNKRPKSKKRYHYPADVKGDKVYISPKGLTSSAAVTRGKKGHDVWSTSKAGAKTIATKIKGSKKPVGPEIHGGGKPGYMWHYHPYNRTPKMHSFYGHART